MMLTNWENTMQYLQCIFLFYLMMYLKFNLYFFTSFMLQNIWLIYYSHFRYFVSFTFVDTYCNCIKTLTQYCDVVVRVVVVFCVTSLFDVVAICVGAFTDDVLFVAGSF